MQLRDYQMAAVDKVFEYWTSGRGECPLICAPTGAGKSVILSELIRRAVQDWPGTRVIAATHVKELIQQNYQALMRMWPSAPAGIYSAGLARRQVGRPITFAGIQSVAKKADQFGHVDLLLIDEAHLIPRSGTTQYQRFISGLRGINPRMKVIGLTATPFRLDSGRLDRGHGAIFDGVAYDIPIQMLVERGYLAPLISKSPKLKFDTAGLHTRAGDYIEREMDARFNTEDVTRQAVAEIIRLGADRKSWLLFCISVDHATKVRDELRVNGISSEVVTGATPAADRARILSEFKAGRIRAITNVNVLTTGFDAPATDLLAFLRPTQSTGLYMQMAGRAMRTAPGKENGLVLDYAGNVMRHGPVDGISVTSAPGSAKGPDAEKGEAPAKECPECGSILRISEMQCPDCGHEFPPPEPVIEREASTAAIMNMTAEDDWRPVQDFAMRRHDPRDGRPVSLRVEYLIDGTAISEWVCIEHSGFPRQKAVHWWHRAAGTQPPGSVAEALDRADEVRAPSEAVIRREGKYWRIHKLRREMAEGAA